MTRYELAVYIFTGTGLIALIVFYHKMRALVKCQELVWDAKEGVWVGYRLVKDGTGALSVLLILSETKNKKGVVLLFNMEYISYHIALITFRNEKSKALIKKMSN